ncbi:uncharacterized protein C9orf152 [Electrophorus electricus]|uniref:TBC1 domain-containing protein n=1 Tax=Electrophorus electricus TaxID=8005 RepID=A0A4W4E1T7_ELEEL|nr:uncharacterized protein C9orf152 [Electrophorus electricus]
MSDCCLNLACPCDQAIRSGEFTEETTNDVEDETASVLTKMDIALLKDQYDSIRDKQKRETRVIYFKNASNDEEIADKSLVSMVPMQQVKHSLKRQVAFQETHFDFVRDPDSAPWRTHLGMYRRTCLAVDANCLQHVKIKTSTGDSASSCSEGNGERSGEVMDSSDLLSEDCEGVDGNQHLSKNGQKDNGSENSKEYSAPAVLSRQLSCGSHQSSRTSASSYHYPFPQLKCPRKSEAAYKLGLYSSF